MLILKKQKKYLSGNNECDNIIKLTTRIIRILEASEPLADFDEDIFKAMIVKIWNDQNEMVRKGTDRPLDCDLLPTYPPDPVAGLSLPRP